MRRRIYSQSGQDALASFLLVRNGLIPGDAQYKGTYIDIGACHPIEYNNTYYFYQKGWSGVCIEPNPDLAGFFSQFRPADKFLPLAIGENQETKSLHRFSNPQWNTFDLKRIQRIERRYNGRVKYLGAVDIEVEKLSNVVEGLNLQSIDLLSVDVEGFEISVFRGFDFDRIRPKLIVFESIIPIELADADEVVMHLKNNGYKLVAHTGHDAFMIDMDRKI